MCPPVGFLLGRACLSGFTEMRPVEGDAAIAEVVEGAQEKQNQGEEGAHLSVAFDQLYAALAASLKVTASCALPAARKVGV